MWERERYIAAGEGRRRSSRQEVKEKKGSRGVGKATTRLKKEEL